MSVRRLLGSTIAAVLISVVPGAAQVTPAAGYTPPDDTPSIKVGVTIFADYTIQQQPKITDADASFHYNYGKNYGDLHAGVYNGETYTQPEINDQKGWMIRGTVRPLPMSETLRGLRVTGFYDHDMFAKHDDRQRGVVSLTF